MNQVTHDYGCLVGMAFHDRKCVCGAETRARGRRRSRKRKASPAVKIVDVEINEHHSSMGTTQSFKTVGVEEDGEEHDYCWGLPCPEILRPESGKRYKVIWVELPSNPKNKPTRNPWAHRPRKRKRRKR